MSTTWNDILDLGDRAPREVRSKAGRGGRPEASGAFSRLRESLSKSRRALTEEISSTLFDRIDDETWERLEEALIYADAGATTTAKVVEKLEHEVDAGDVPADGEAIKARLVEILAEIAATNRAPIDLSAEPAVLLMTGVNGTGKTTTIGKIAWHLQNEFGLSVLLGAADTYRAAAAEQLTTWAERSGAGHRALERRRRPRLGRLRHDRRRPGPRLRRGDHRHRRPPPHPVEPDGRARQGPPGDRQAASRRPARDPDLDRRHHRPERPAPGPGLRRGDRRSTASS